MPTLPTMPASPGDTEVQQTVYRITAESGRPPRAEKVAQILGLESAEALAAFRRLNGRRLLALAPESGEITMAPPFAAAPTSFLVDVAGRTYFANCVWDAFGIAAALAEDAAVDSSCACCGEPMRLEIRDGSPVPTPAIAHFAVPAARWWEDIADT